MSLAQIEDLVNQILSPTELFQEELQKAVNFANTAHSGQFRKHSGLPYVAHPYQVLSLVSEWNALDPETIKLTKDGWDLSKALPDLILWKAALCHDIREEREDIDYSKMVCIIGREAADVCEELTFIPDRANPLPDPMQKIGYIKTFSSKSLRALICKCADRIRNTEDFLRDAPDYAGKYWRKGLPLFDSMFIRGEEITAKFGPDVFPRMKYSKDMLQRQIVK